jgi:HPt (histidine-containing phosphotransfer) domain-containing protein
MNRQMITENQLAANRRNAELSTGPRTDEGKHRSAMNARRHNLTGQVSAMTPEDRAAHDAFSDAMLKDLAPQGAVETQLAQRVATDSWRLNRISAIEDNLFALGFDGHAHEIDSDHPQIHAALTAAKTFQAEAKHLQLLSLYEQRLNRAVHKNLGALKNLQAERKAQREAEMDQAKKLQQLSQVKGHQYDPDKDGFVFSSDEIRAAVDRDRRLQRAEHLHFRRDKHEKRLAQAA